MALGYALKYWRNMGKKCRMSIERTSRLQKNKRYAIIYLSRKYLDNRLNLLGLRTSDNVPLLQK